jgi:hypothetical protein
VADWVEEIQAFPEGKYDDHVDALSMFLDFMVSKPRLDPHQRPSFMCVVVNNRGLRKEVARESDPSRLGAIGIVNRPHRLPSTEWTPPVICGTPSGHIFLRPR